jgi:hypothetical protein
MCQMGTAGWYPACRAVYRQLEARRILVIILRTGRSVPPE